MEPHEGDLEEESFALMTMADDRAARETSVAGRGRRGGEGGGDKPCSR
jgi:hypothetical protein